MYWEEEEMRTEYGVHFKSSDGKEEHITGHYTDVNDAMASMGRKIANGNKDVYLVTREVTEWMHFIPHRKEDKWRLKETANTI